MKSITWAMAAIAACLATYVSADGVCYDPNHGAGANIGAVAGDMATIKAKGFSHVRTYISAIGNHDMASIVAASGLRSMLGVPYPDGDYKLHVENAIKAAKTGTVDYIMVGNENLPGRGDPAEMARIINDIKSRAPGVRVGTVQTTAAYINRQVGQAVLDASTVLGVNIHPFFTAGIKVEGGDAIRNAKSQWDQCINALGGNSGKLVLTETGWPSDGNFRGSQGSKGSAQQYWNDYKATFGFLPQNAKFYFQFFDTGYKDQAYEKTFGLFGKIDASGTQATTPPPTPPPTTPAPTTTVPATTTPAHTNATSTAGSAAGESDLPAGSSSHHGSSPEVGGDSNSDTNLGLPTTENGELDGTPAPGATESSDPTETGENKKNDSTEANTKTAASDGSAAGIIVVALFGCAAIGAAFAFIYKARQKAKELEESESKDFDHSITPGGACVL